MSLDPEEKRQLHDIGKAVTRIDERTKRMDVETDRRFASAHKRIDEVRGDAKSAGGKAGGVVGGVAGAVLAALLKALGFPGGDA